MKANEAPEKIKVKITHPISDEYTEMIAFENGAGIEYIRADAFIEKACDWIEDHIYDYLKMNRTWNEPDYEPKLIEDFRKAMTMKGE